MSRQEGNISHGLLDRFGVHPQRVEDPGSGGFSGAVVLHLYCDEGEYCLRGWPATGLPTERILGLHRLLGFTFEAGVHHVAVPVRTESGSTLVEVDGRRWQLEPWLPGTADFWSQRSETRLRSAMRALAAWHRAAAEFIPQQHEAAWFAVHAAERSPAVGERIRLIDSWIPHRVYVLRQRFSQHDWPRLSDLGSQIIDMFVRTAGHVGDELRTVQHEPFPLQPCLRDVWHDHVLFTGDDVTGLIDAAACRTENVATDLARLIGSLVGDDSPSWDFAIKEYNQIRPLSLAEMALVHVLDRSSVLLSGMNWLDRILFQQERALDRSRVEERMQTIVQRLTHLAATI